MIIAACVCERVRVCIGAGFRFFMPVYPFGVCRGLAAIWGSVHIVLSGRKNVHPFVILNEFMSVFMKVCVGVLCL